MRLSSGKKFLIQGGVHAKCKQSAYINRLTAISTPIFLFHFYFYTESACVPQGNIFLLACSIDNETSTSNDSLEIGSKSHLYSSNYASFRPSLPLAKKTTKISVRKPIHLPSNPPGYFSIMLVSGHFYSLDYASLRQFLLFTLILLAFGLFFYFISSFVS